MGLLGGCMVVTIQDVLDGSIHGEAEHLFGIVPFEIYTGKIGAFPIFSDSVVCLEGFTQVVDIAITDILYTKIVNNED